MAATGYVLPAAVDLEVIIGADAQWTVTLYTDTAHTTPFDLTGYTCSVIIGTNLSAPFLTLTSGSGLTITAGSGQITIALTNTQTGNAVPQPNPDVTYRYKLSLTDGSGIKTVPMSGDMTFHVP